MAYQNTVAMEARFTGVGLHSGEKVNMVVRPAPADSGIRFRVATGDGVPSTIAATADNVAATAYATSLRDGEASVQLVEHILSALSGLGIDNAEIAVDALEVPIMDGSAAPFIHGLLQAGVRTLGASRQVVRILEPIRVEDDGGDKWLEVLPVGAPETIIDYNIDFDHHTVGTQRYRFVMSRECFVGELCAARTFGFAREVQALQQLGLARGGSLENAVVMDDNGVMNPEGLRFENEQVRHKILDLIGDMSLVGHPVVGHFVAHRAGHGLHNKLARAILAHTEAWELIDQDAVQPLSGGVAFHQAVA